MDENCILETKNLTKEFKGFVAVDSVDLRVPARFMRLSAPTARVRQRSSTC